MSILLPPKVAPPEPLWLPGPQLLRLPANEIHVWRARMATEPLPWEDDPMSQDRTERLNSALFRNEILDRYNVPTLACSPRVVANPAFDLQVVSARCDGLVLLALSRNVRKLGLETEQVCEDVPIDEMAADCLDAHAQWDLRTTWSPREKAWKFFQLWTRSEACAQARGSSKAADRCEVREFSPDLDFIAALAINGPAASIHFWDWQCPM